MNTYEERKDYLYDKTQELVEGMREIADTLDLELVRVWQFAWIYANTRWDEEPGNVE